GDFVPDAAGARLLGVVRRNPVALCAFVWMCGVERRVAEWAVSHRGDRRIGFDRWHDNFVGLLELALPFPCVEISRNQPWSQYKKLNLCKNSPLSSLTSTSICAMPRLRITPAPGTVCRSRTAAK